MLPNNNQHICSMDEIYVDESIQQNQNQQRNNQSQRNQTHPVRGLFPINLPPSNNTSFRNQERNLMLMNSREEENNALCSICHTQIYSGETVIQCNCKNYYHPNCISNQLPNFNNEICQRCQSKFEAAIYHLKVFPNFLNTSSFSHEFGKADVQNNSFNATMNNSRSTLDHSRMSMDTNINRLENYEQICETVGAMNTEEKVIELIKGAKTIDNNSMEGSSNRMLSFGSTGNSLGSNMNINNQSFFNQGKGFLSPIPTQKVSSFQDNHRDSVGTDTIKKNLDQLNNGLSPNSGNECSANLLNEFSFQSGIQNQNQSQFSQSSINERNNTTLIPLLETQLSQNQSNELLKNMNIPEFDDEDDTQPMGEEADKENCPPIPKTTSLTQLRLINTTPNQNQNIFSEGNIQSFNDNDFDINNDILNISLEAGISHIISDCQKLITIPISVDVEINPKAKQIAKFSYAKDHLIIFNTSELNLQTKFQILGNISNLMGDYDRIYSNVIKGNKWLTKMDLCNIISQPQNAEQFIEGNNLTLNYLDLINAVLYGLDLSLEFHANIFSMLIFCDNGAIGLNEDYSQKFQEVGNKIKESKINFFKEFSINIITLDNKTIQKTQENLRYYNFLYDLSLLCLGYFYTCSNFDELIKTVGLFFTTKNQTALINSKLILKINRDPSIVFSGLIFPFNKIDHNAYEVYLGSILMKEKKTYNFNLTVILNQQNIKLSLPLVEVSAEYLISKNTITEFKNYQNGNNQSQMNFMNNFNNFLNLIRNRTMFYSLSLPILNENKPVLIGNSVVLKHIFSESAKRIDESIMFLKNYQFIQAYNLLQKEKENLENALINRTTLFQNLLSKVQKDLQGNNANQFNINNSIFNQPQNKKEECLSQITKWMKMILKDINHISQEIMENSGRNIAECYSICESLLYERPVILDDQRFLDKI
ncbi:MAG: hypothetical protein MJ252_20285 [archaeon]|nr:hypothetical protein [archaeon]